MVRCAGARRRRGARCLVVAALVAAGILAGGPAGQAQPPATPALLAATPYMGWDSAYALPSGSGEAAVLQQASLMRASGLEAIGYRLIWLDAGWWQGQRNPSGDPVVSAVQWPHGMAWLAATLHANGFRLGLYTDAGSSGCPNNPSGAFGHYQQDIDTFARWGVDALKVDWCGGVSAGLDPATQYTQIHQAILDDSPRRPMLLEVCNFLQPGQKAAGAPSFAQSVFSAYTFGPLVATSWRTDTDIGSLGSVRFSSVLRNLDADATQPQAAGPGHWNDPGYLGPGQGMNGAQFRTQMSLWALLAAPLMVSANMTHLGPTSLADLRNRALIAIDQDPAGVQGWLVPGSVAGDGEAWERPLADGSYAVALLNRGTTTQTVATSAAALGLALATRYKVTNVWSASASATTGALSASVAPGATVLLRVRAG